MYVIGTAGHVDHGKSTLVQALTGIDPDRLQEEKRRGMTIDLGFAWLTLPGGETVSIVDVPGHERFIKNMLAGVGGIDLAVLVVAADEGVMPQTREHLAILHLLGVSQGVIAVTKRDLVDEEWLELVVADIEETIAGTRLAGSPIAPVSAVTGEGLAELRSTLATRLLATVPKRDIGRPRLAIDRAFSISGFGTVVTGTLIDGSLRLGQEVEIAPVGLRSRVRGLQTHRTKVETARPGSRVAVNLPGISTEDAARGLVLTTPAWLGSAGAVDVHLAALKDLAHPLRHNLSVTFHSGAAESPAKLRLLDRDALEPGESAWAQIRIDQPVALVAGDAFVIRSSDMTLGGGRIVETRARRHRRRHQPTLDALARRAQGTPEETVYSLIERSEPATEAALARGSDLGAPGVSEAVQSLAAGGRVVLVGEGEYTAPPLIWTAAGYQNLTELATAALGAYADQHPLRSGMPREELKSRTRLQAKPFAALVGHWAREAVVKDNGATISLPGRVARLSAAQERETAAFLVALRTTPYAPSPAAFPEPDLLAYLVEAGQVVAVAEGVVFDAAAYETMVERVTARLREDGRITLAQVRDLFGASRKYAQALLEHLDERRITRRVGDERVLR